MMLGKGGKVEREREKVGKREGETRLKKGCTAGCSNNKPSEACPASSIGRA
jgi:hypothetical protein